MVMADMNTQKGTRGNNKASFTKDGINGSKFEKWTLEETNLMIDKLEEWLRPEVKRDKRTGEITDITFKTNRIFFKDWLMANGLYNDWIRYVSKKYETVSERIKEIKETQEDLIVRASAMGQIKERTAQFILMQWYDWRTKSDNKNMDVTPVVWKETKKYVEKKK